MNKKNVVSWDTSIILVRTNILPDLDKLNFEVGTNVYNNIILFTLRPSIS